MSTQQEALTGVRPVRAVNFCACLDPTHRLDGDSRQAIIQVYNRFVTHWNDGAAPVCASRPEDDFSPLEFDSNGRAIDRIADRDEDISGWRFHCHRETIRLCRASRSGDEFLPIPIGHGGEQTTFWRILALKPNGETYEIRTKPTWHPMGGVYFGLRRNRVHPAAVLSGFSHEAGGCKHG